MLICIHIISNVNVCDPHPLLWVDNNNGVREEQLCFLLRLRTIIARCIHIWQTSLVKAYTSYLQEAKEVLTCNHQQRMEEKDCMLIFSFLQVTE